MPQQIGFIFFVLFGIAILLVATMVGLFLIFGRKKNQIIEKNLKKELEMQRQKYQTELQALRSQMNPHFVYNSLNAIQYYIQRNEVELSENYLVKFSKLVRLFFEYSRRQYITIRQEVDLLQHYLTLEKLRFEEKLNFEIRIDERIEDDEQQIPSMLLQPIVENAVNHGVFHKEEKGNILVHFVYLDVNAFKVIIEDDGIGFSKSKKIYNASSQQYQSRSSNVLEERLELLNQSKEWKVTFEMKEKQGGEEGTGTIVSIDFFQII